MTIAFLDVDYRSDKARAACALAESWSSEVPSTVYVSDLASVPKYEPGAFYRRELPCLLQVLGLLTVSPDFLVVDGYVWLCDPANPGLGAHLYQTMGARAPVIGVAKTAFLAAESCPSVVKVHRGSSKKPLFVTAVGIPTELAATWVHGMAGPHRIPSLLAATDQASRRT